MKLKRLLIKVIIAGAKRHIAGIFYPPGDTPHKARMTFMLLLAAKKSCSRFLFWFGAARR